MKSNLFHSSEEERKPKPYMSQTLSGRTPKPPERYTVKKVKSKKKKKKQKVKHNSTIT